MKPVAKINETHNQSQIIHKLKTQPNLKKGRERKRIEERERIGEGEEKKKMRGRESERIGEAAEKKRRKKKNQKS